MDEKLIQEIADLVIKKITERRKTAVVVFTGSNINCDTALDSLRCLRDEGYTFRVMMSGAACRILSEQRIVDALAPIELWKGSADLTPEALSKMYDNFIVPTMTVNTAAHVASCMADSPSAALILDALMRGKNVVVAVDGCCPDNEQRAIRGFRFAPALRDRLRQNIETLRDYGAKLTTTERLAQSVRKAFGAVAFGSTEASPNVQTISETKSGSRVVGANDVRACAAGGILSVPEGALITMLAREEAAKLGVTIRCAR